MYCRYLPMSNGKVYSTENHLFIMVSREFLKKMMLQENIYFFKFHAVMVIISREIPL